MVYLLSSTAACPAILKQPCQPQIRIHQIGGNTFHTDVPFDVEDTGWVDVALIYVGVLLDVVQRIDIASSSHPQGGSIGGAEQINSTVLRMRNIFEIFLLRDHERSPKKELVLTKGFAVELKHRV